MKKRVRTYKLNRDTQQRSALLKGLLSALIQHESIITTTAKAKAVMPIFDKFVTHAKKATLTSRRLVQAYLQDGQLVHKLFADIAPRYQEVKGGYTRLLPVGMRQGDSAKLSKLSLTKQKLITPSSSPTPSDHTKLPKPKKSLSLATPPLEKITAPTKTAPKLVKRTARRGDK